MGATPQPLQTQAGNGISVTVKNLDSTAHIVHGNTGFPHGDIAIAPGGVDTKVRTLQAGVTTSGYIHGETNGTSVGFAIKVNTAP